MAWGTFGDVPGRSGTFREFSSHPKREDKRGFNDKTVGPDCCDLQCKSFHNVARDLVLVYLNKKSAGWAGVCTLIPGCDSKGFLPSKRRARVRTDGLGYFRGRSGTFREFSPHPKSEDKRGFNDKAWGARLLRSVVQVLS